MLFSCRLVLTLAALAAAPAAFAQGGYIDAYGRAYLADPNEGYQPRQSALTGRACVKQCPNDMLPCDPPGFKIADGRCTRDWN